MDPKSCCSDFDSTIFFLKIPNSSFWGPLNSKSK
jgi:hypothetical protein